MAKKVAEAKGVCLGYPIVVTAVEDQGRYVVVGEIYKFGKWESGRIRRYEERLSDVRERIAKNCISWEKATIRFYNV